MEKQITWSIRFIALFICSLSFLNVHAQKNTNVKGTVYDSNNEPLVGATVSVKGNSSNGTITNIDGQFSLNVQDLKSTLVVSFVGYQTQEVALHGRSEITIRLQEDAQALDEVVVVGYGTQKKKFLIGSVSQVGSKELMMAPQANLSNMMTGKLPGVTSVQRSGLPGNDQTSINIRGLGTFLDSSPLILVDGVERMLNTVNPNDVENISILKDAATASVYGLAAANGVILVTTKKGTEGKVTLSYDGSVTFQKNTAMPEMLNGPDYIYWYNKASELDGNGPYYGADIQTKVANNYDPEGKYGNTNWTKEVFKDYGFTHQHNISASGGNKNIRFFTSIGMLDQSGIIENVNYDRYNVRSNVEGNITKDLTFELNISGFYEEKNWPGISTSAQAEQNPIQQAVYSAPIIPIYYQGEYTAWIGPGSSTTQSPLATLRNSGFQKNQRHEFDGTMKISYAFPWVKGLKASLGLVYDTSYSEDNGFLVGYNVNAYSADSKSYNLMRASSTSEKGNYTKSASSFRRFMVRPSVEYANTFGKHAVSALFLYEQTQLKGSTMTGKMGGYNFNDPVDLSLGTEFISNPTGSHSDKATIGYVGRFNYIFDKRYLAEFAFRVDGSYKFAKDKRWGFFPSVSLGWVISEENFIKNNFSSINLLKLRASVGELGSDNTDAFLHRSIFKVEKNAYIFGGVPYAGLGASNSITSSLTWSTTRSYNIGADLTMWNGLLGVEFDLFYKLTKDIQESRSGGFPPSLGGNYAQKGNTGKIDNRGFELVLKHQNHVNDFYYSITGSVAWARNKVLSRIESESTPWYRTNIGEPLGQIYGYKAIGLYQTQEQLDNRPFVGNGVQRLGDIMYEDINGDGKITQDGDKVKIGHSTLPELNYSLSMDFNWKGFNLSALWQGAAIVSYTLNGTYHHGSMDNTVYTRPFYSGGNAPYYLVEDSWTPENTSARYPRLSAIHNGNNAYTSSWWLVNGNFLRLKNLQFGYTIPKKILAKANIGLSNVRVHVAGTNLFTFTEFKYCDPEMAIINNGYYPQQKNYSVGLNITF